MSRGSDEQVAANLRAMTIEGVRVLALEAPEQIRYFPGFVSVPDELIRGISDPLGLIEASGIDGVLRPAEANDLRALVSRCQCLFADVPHLQETPPDDLLAEPGWQEVRAFARVLLHRHRWEGPPSGDFSSFVPSR